MILLDSQQQAYDKLKKLKVGALFMEAGTGKTLTTIKLIESTDTDFCLFIVPFQTKDNFRAELVKWRFKRPYIIVGVESLSMSDRIFLEVLDSVQSANKAFVVVDESLKIKNKNSIRTQRVMQLGELAEYRLILNGTPLSKNVIDIWTQMEFLSPQILNMKYDQFVDTFVEYIKFKTSHGWQSYIKSYENMDYLYSLIDPFVFDARLDLDKHKQYMKVDYEVTNKQSYLEIKDNYLNVLRMTDDTNIFMAMTQELQMSYCIDSGKMDALKEILANCEPDETLIYCKYIKSANAINGMFPEYKTMTYGKGALGLNLQAYNCMIFFDKTFDYAQREQAEHRIFRIGQKNDVKYYTLNGDVGLESLIQRNIDRKMEMLTYFKKIASEQNVEAIFNEL